MIYYLKIETFLLLSGVNSGEIVKRKYNEFLIFRNGKEEFYLWKKAKIKIATIRKRLTFFYKQANAN